MTNKRLTGFFEWYTATKGYGVIRGEDGQEYFAHSRNHPDTLRPNQGMWVSFEPVPRPRGKGGMEAHSIQETEPDQTPPSIRAVSTPRTIGPSRVQPPLPAPPPETKRAIESVADEVLRRQRERRRGLLPERTEDLPPGTRVQHARFGAGTVELAAPSVISVRFDNAPRVPCELSRTEVQPLKQEPTTSQPRPVVRERSADGSAIADFISSLRADVQETLLEEEIENNGVYAFVPAKQPTMSPQPMQLDSRIAGAFRATSGIQNFYSHQIEARQALLDGKNVLITTPTASGKTEAYNPTRLETLINDQEARALYLFPLVALSFDQQDRLLKLNRALPRQDQLEIGISNKDVDEQEKKEMLRRENRILITTPDSLHKKFLPKPYPNWKRFFANLRYVVLDEAHVYRGVLGANMANIVRRLLVRCRREGNPNFPQIIVSSATVGNAGELAYQLTGLPADSFHHIAESGAPGADRHFLISRPDIHSLGELCAALLDVSTLDVVKQEVRPVRTIAFLRSINGVKRATDQVRKHLRRTGRAHLEDTVDAYYADKGDKSDVLQKLRDGDVRCLFTTTALMAGINIGALDVSIVDGFPGMVMDARQMFGRAGRAGEGAAIFLAKRTDPFDQFYLERPSILFQEGTEAVIANQSNPLLLAAHLRCAAQTSDVKYKNREGPLSGYWVSLFGPTGKDWLDGLVEARMLRVEAGQYYLDHGNPHNEEPLTNIRAMQQNTYRLYDEADLDQVLEEKQETTAFRDAHPGAIIWCSGETYRVLSLNRETHQIKCRPEPDKHLSTRGAEKIEISILKSDQPGPSYSMNGSKLGSGRIRITTTVPEYRLLQTSTVMQCRNRRCRHETPNLETRHCPKCRGPVRPKQKEELIDTKTIDLTPPLFTKLETRACWLELPPHFKKTFEQSFWPRWAVENGNTAPAAIAPSFEHALHSVEHAILKALPEHIRCDKDEIGGIHEANAQGARIYIYDNFPGGLGLADEFADDPMPILKKALSVLERCTCADDEGCPVCLSLFGCHMFNQTLSKLAGRYLLRLLIGDDTSTVLDDLEEYADIYIQPDNLISTAESVDVYTAFSGNTMLSVDEEEWWKNVEPPPEVEEYYNEEDMPF